MNARDVTEDVRARYAEAAVAVSRGGCCGPDAAGGDTMTACGYGPEDRTGLPDQVIRASLGCGNPFFVADLRPGETVLDLGAGGGLDVLLSARRVGPHGKAYGLDMTDEMLGLARRNAVAAGATNVEFLKGTIEEIPLPDASVDVIISNCVINLSVDKPAVFAQMYRVLRPGGRVGVADVVAEDRQGPAERAQRGDWASCAAGALSRSEYIERLSAAGFTGIDITFTDAASNGLHAALIRAVRP